MRNRYVPLVSSLILSLAACSGGGESEVDGGGTDEIPSLSLTGSLVDFSTGDPLTGGATVSADGIVPAPTITVTGANFEITGIPPFSNFHLLAGSPPVYRSTYSAVILVEDTDRAGLTLETLSEDFIESLYTTFGVTEADGTSLVVAKLVDDQGEPVADVDAADFDLPANTEGPFFLDADKAPDAGLTKSSASGYVVVFNVMPGLTSFSADDAANLTMVMADSPVANRAATLAEIVVTDGALVVPTGVSFRDDITPIFERRGCVTCHSGGGIGKDLGGLHLNGEANKMYKELVEEVSANHGTVRVNIEVPHESLMLTLPSKEEPPDVHPNSTFLSGADPDYLLMLGWIQEGALDN